MASIRDVAKKTGVGVGTVSWTFNGAGYVAEDTKAKILAVAEKLDYQSNELARNLFRNRTGIIRIAVPDMENPFFSKPLRHTEIQLYKNGREATICNTIEISNREQDFIDVLRQNVMDKIIIGAHFLQDYTYLNLNKSAVAMGQNLGPDIPVIHPNHKAGRRTAIRLPLDVGYRSVLNFSSLFRVHTPSNDRHQEFEQVTEENGVSVKIIEMTWNMMEYDYYCRIMEWYMDTYRDIGGVSTTDIGAFYYLSITNQRSVKIPEKPRIIGYDVADITRLFTSKPISIAQNIPGLVTARVDIMTDPSNGKKVEMEQILPVSIQKGGTV